MDLPSTPQFKPERCEHPELWTGTILEVEISLKWAELTYVFPTITSLIVAAVIPSRVRVIMTILHAYVSAYTKDYTNPSVMCAPIPCCPRGGDQVLHREVYPHIGKFSPKHGVPES